MGKKKSYFFGKITIIKTLAISKLVYNASVLDMPIHIFPKIEKLLYRFLWGGKNEKIRIKTLIMKVEVGAINMIDLNSMVNSRRLSWIKRLLSPDPGKWKCVPK